GWVGPSAGAVREMPLGPRAAPHGVNVGPDAAPWITDGGQNAIVRVDPQTSEVKRFPLNTSRNANLNTAVFDRFGMLWFTGQSGVYGRVDPSAGTVQVGDAPRGPGPHGLIATPGRGRVVFCSLGRHHIPPVNLDAGEAP